MKWLATFALTLILIARVVPLPTDEGATIVFEDGAQLTVYGAVPTVGEADVSYSDCYWWSLYTVCRAATITQAGVTYQAVP